MTSIEAMTSRETLRGRPTEVKPRRDGLRRSMVADMSQATLSAESGNQNRCSESSDSPTRVVSFTSTSPYASTESLVKGGWRGSPKRFLERVKSRKSWGSPKRNVHGGGSPGKECHTPNSVGE